MKSIDKLRASQYVGQHMSLSEIADEIEAEISERYMLRPMDADSVRIELGDKLIEHEDGHEFIVDGLKIWGSTYEWWAYEDGGVQAPAMRCTHVKPRTLEDVLADFVDEAAWEQSPDSYDEIKRKLITLYAVEIRELLGGDE